MNNRRETSVAVLSDMIVRMKREIDGKNKCVKFFEDIAGKIINLLGQILFNKMTKFFVGNRMVERCSR